MSAGRWTLRWNGRSESGPVRPGVYLLRVSVADRSLIKRVVMVH